MESVEEVRTALKDLKNDPKDAEAVNDVMLCILQFSPFWSIQSLRGFPYRRAVRLAFYLQEAGLTQICGGSAQDVLAQFFV